MVSDSSNSDRWHRVLDQLEADIAAALRHEGVHAWSAPEGMGPMSPEVLTRALRILDAQSEAVAMLKRAKNMTTRHLEVVDAVPATRIHRPSALLDISA